MSWYLDSSAILKLIFDEKERSDLLKVLKTKSITSRVSRIEVSRSVIRLAPKQLELARLELSKIDTFPISAVVLNLAESFGSNINLRTLDSIHVATALILGSGIEGIITYDKAMMKSAKELGIKVIHPGMK